MRFYRKGLLAVLSSPSGGGKTSIRNGILKRHPEFTYSVSATTRPARPDEKNEIDYHFLTESEFLKKIEANEFIEWAFVHGYRYGTLKATVLKALLRNEVMIFDLDVNGADAMKATFGDDVVNIFILPPTKEELAKRLISRGTDDPEVIKIRLENAQKEVFRAVNYDYLIINDSLDACIDRVESVITAELCRPCRVLPIEEWNI